MDDIIHFLLKLYYKTYVVKGFDLGSYTELSESSLLALHWGCKEGGKQLLTLYITISVDIMCDQRLERKLVFVKPSHNTPEIQILKGKPDQMEAYAFILRQSKSPCGNMITG